MGGPPGGGTVGGIMGLADKVGQIVGGGTTGCVGRGGGGTVMGGGGTRGLKNGGGGILGLKIGGGYGGNTTFGGGTEIPFELSEGLLSSSVTSKVSSFELIDDNDMASSLSSLFTSPTQFSSSFASMSEYRSMGAGS